MSFTEASFEFPKTDGASAGKGEGGCMTNSSCYVCISSRCRRGRAGPSSAKYVLVAGIQSRAVLGTTSMGPPSVMDADIRSSGS